MKHFMYDPATEFILGSLISRTCYQYHSIVHFDLLTQYLNSRYSASFWSIWWYHNYQHPSWTSYRFPLCAVMLHGLHGSKRGPFRSGRKYFIFIIVFIIINYLHISWDLMLGDIKNPRIVANKLRTKDIRDFIRATAHSIIVTLWSIRLWCYLVFVTVMYLVFK